MARKKVLRCGILTGLWRLCHDVASRMSASALRAATEAPQSNAIGRGWRTFSSWCGLLLLTRYRTARRLRRHCEGTVRAACLVRSGHCHRQALRRYVSEALRCGSLHCSRTLAVADEVDCRFCTGDTQDREGSKDGSRLHSDGVWLVIRFEGRV